jgi:tRNA modification GTPase
MRKALENKISEIVDHLGNEEMAINTRHQGILSNCHQHLLIASQGMESSIGIELISHDLREALSFLSQVVGEDDNEEMLDHLFSQFCIGK